MRKTTKITKDTIMGMTPNMCVKLFEEQQAEILRLTRLVEKQGKKCNKYQKMLAAAHFGGEDKIPSKKKQAGNSRHTFAGFRGSGYYSFFDNGELVIGEIHHRGSHELYRGKYRGSHTPYLREIKQANLRMYNSIIKFFADEPVEEHNMLYYYYTVYHGYPSTRNGHRSLMFYNGANVYTNKETAQELAAHPWSEESASVLCIDTVNRVVWDIDSPDDKIEISQETIDSLQIVG